MTENQAITNIFETQRGQLRAMAYRMLGSFTEAEDAVQETWLRLNRSDTDAIGNLGGWLTTVTTRLCLDRLRQRSARREEPLDPHLLRREIQGSAEEDLALADAIGLALLVVLNRLKPSERIAFVLHDMFELPFDEIAAILDRTPEATRKLASRARKRVHGSQPTPDGAPDSHRRIAEAFLAASRSGDLAGLVALLDPDVILQSDVAAVRLGGKPELRGADAVARVFSGRADAARLALVDDEIGFVVAPAGALLLVLRLTFRRERIAQIAAIANPTDLDGFNLAVPAV